MNNIILNYVNASYFKCVCVCVCVCVCECARVSYTQFCKMLKQVFKMLK